jgi:LPS export ABC transporter protein LptC
MNQKLRTIGRKTRTFQKISMKYVIVYVLCIISLLALIGCEEKIKPSVMSDVQISASQESWNSTVTFTESGKVKAVLKAGHIAMYASQQQTLLDEGVQVDFFDQQERHTSVLTSKRGKVDDKTHDMEAYEQVVVVSDSGTVVETDTLLWTNSTRKVHSNDYVKITSPDESLQGFGFESDQTLKNYTIFRVTGVSKAKQ